MPASGGSARRATLLAAVALVVAGRVEPSSAIDRDRAAEHLAAAIRFRTVSHQDPSEDDRAQFVGLRAFLARTYPKVHRSLVRELVNGDGLLYTWKGADASAKPVLLMAHQDVVPIEPGTEGRWAHPPFGGVIADGFVWGRGALDDKASLVFLMEAIESLLAEGFRPPQTVYLASGFDEEVGGLEGAARIAALLAQRGVRLDYVLDEGRFVSQGVVPGVQEPVASIGIAEKGYVSVELVAETEGGHSSRPPPETAIGLLAAAIDRLERHPMPARLHGAPRREMQALAPYMPFGKRLMLSNLWLFEPLVVRTLAGIERRIACLSPAGTDDSRALSQCGACPGPGPRGNGLAPLRRRGRRRLPLHALPRRPPGPHALPRDGRALRDRADRTRG